MRLSVSSLLSLLSHALSLPKMRCIALSGAADEGSYNSTSRELVMRISSSLPAGEAAEITVPPEATIRLPPAGVPAGIQISGLNPQP